MERSPYSIRVSGSIQQRNRLWLWRWLTTTTTWGRVVVDEAGLSYRPWMLDRLLLRLPRRYQHEDTRVLIHTRPFPEASWIDLKVGDELLELQSLWGSLDQLIAHLRRSGYVVEFEAR